MSLRDSVKVVDRRRHAGVTRYAKPSGELRSSGLAHVYRGRARKTLRDLYDDDHVGSGHGGHFRWLASTCIAGTVGAIAILAVLYGASDKRESADGLLPAMQRLGEGAMPPNVMPQIKRVAGLNWLLPKSDRLQTLTGAIATRHVIHETVKERRGGREYIHAKPYVRVTARMAPVPADKATDIPTFNPFKLYANKAPIATAHATKQLVPTNVKIRVVELLGGILPREDGQELDTREVAELVEQAREEDLAVDAIDPTLEVGVLDLRQTQADGLDAPLPPQTSVLIKTPQETEDEAETLLASEKRVVQVGRGDTLIGILGRAGADKWQAAAMVESAKKLFPDRSLQAGQEIHIALVPSLTEPSQMSPSGFSVFSAGHEHLVSVSRDEAGEFIAAKTPANGEKAVFRLLSDGKERAATNLYSAVYYAARLQSIPDQTILRILRVHAYETDYRRRVRPGDTAEFFFDTKETGAANGKPGDLLLTQIVAGGERSRFYRYRTRDGETDYYDENGNNSRKFLMRRPVRSSNVRLTSGFGPRFHPLLNRRKMHYGVDWAAAPGTPIMAAGSGTIEQAGRKGYYGNYIRIRHANGYHTAYGHMKRLARGARKGVKVRQGQIIGYVGSTGLSSGPHLHFEVLVNKQFVNPMSIQVPRERQLTGRELAAFQKERVRIDDLMRRAPVLMESK